MQVGDDIRACLMHHGAILMIGKRYLLDTNI